MTAFYMFRLMSMTFFGSYRGPACGAPPATATGTAATAPGTGRTSRPGR